MNRREEDESPTLDGPLGYILASRVKFTELVRAKKQEEGSGRWVASVRGCSAKAVVNEAASSFRGGIHVRMNACRRARALVKDSSAWYRM